jgi:hypothetical protein
MSLENEMQLIDYSEKACAVFGNTRDYREALKAMGGKFNMNLVRRKPVVSDNGRANIGDSETTEAGWVFPKTSKPAVLEYLKSGNINEKYSTASSLKPYSPGSKKPSAGGDDGITISRKAFDSMIDRITSLEKQVASMCPGGLCPGTPENATTHMTAVDSSLLHTRASVDADEAPRGRLLRRK